LTVLIIFATLAIWGALAVLRAKGLTPVARSVLGALILGTGALLIGWVIFVLPAYMD